MLAELGRRFHARLDRLGLPHYRMKVTSALRTDETQAELRRINSYASRTVSAHEFGTTIDVSHERFAVPAGTGEMEAEVLEEVGKEHAKVLQAELGRAIAEMRDAHDLHVMMENQQPVYHMTVARRFAGAAAPR
jgi:precorrin-6B methylase 1